MNLLAVIGADPTSSTSAPVDWSVLSWALTRGFFLAALGTGLTVIVLTSDTAPDGRRSYKTVLRNLRPENLRLVRQKLKAKAGASNAGQGLPAAPAWKFSDSWATNLTGLTTAFGVIVAATKDTTGVLEAGSAASFALTTAALLAVAALAPVAYSAFQERRKSGGLHGTIRGLFLATFLTLSAVYGSIAALVHLANNSLEGVRPPYGLVDAIAVVVTALIATYAVRTVCWLVDDAATAAKDGSSSLVGVITVDCCGESTKARRLSLL